MYCLEKSRSGVIVMKWKNGMHIKVLWFTWATITKYHNLGDLNDKNLLCQFWRLDIQDRRCWHVCSSWEQCERICFLPLCLASGGFLAVFDISLSFPRDSVEALCELCLYLHIVFSQCACLWDHISSIYRNTNHTGLGPHW